MRQIAANGRSCTWLIEFEPCPSTALTDTARLSQESCRPERGRCQHSRGSGGTGGPDARTGDDSGRTHAGRDRTHGRLALEGRSHCVDHSLCELLVGDGTRWRVRLQLRSERNAAFVVEKGSAGDIRVARELLPDT